MKNLILFGFVFAYVAVGTASLQAQEKKTADEDPAHEELRALRDGLIEANEKRDLEGVLGYVHKDVVVTWQNAETNRGHDELRAFYRRMMVGDDRVVESVKHNLTLDDLSILYGGDTAVAFGSMDDDFKLMGGIQFNLHSRWTATMVKEGDRWVVASYHVSANLFDNPLLTVAKNSLYLIGTIASVIGLAIGVIGTIIVTKVRKRKA